MLYFWLCFIFYFDLYVFNSGVQFLNTLQQRVNKKLANRKRTRFNVDILAPHLRRNLFEHQKEAIRWMLALREDGLSGLLAHEMGLGKSCSVIAFIAYLKFVE